MEKKIVTTKNKIYLDADQIITVVYRGDQTTESLADTVEQSTKMVDAFITRDIPVLMIADIRELGNYPDSARLIGMRARVQIPFWRVAIVVPKDPKDAMKQTVDMSKRLTAMAGRKKEIRYFTSINQATNWLNQVEYTLF